MRRRREEQRPGTQHAACQLHNATAFLFAPKPVKHTGLITTMQADGTSLTLTMGQERSKDGQNFIAQGRKTAQFLPLMFKRRIMQSQYKQQSPAQELGRPVER